MFPRRTLIAVTAALVTLCGTAPALADDGWAGADPVTGQFVDPDDGRLDGVGNTGGTGGTVGNDDFDFLGPGGPDDPGRTPRGH
ncbi:hypothetical protein ACFY6U_48210 [Streptomyces sp. NPDC013157]|uniref:hypothetical protein n=1 Tax=Streptomyces sp. NPDC013157 TaxID=3364861 RepID=UPI0036BAF2AA